MNNYINDGGLATWIQTHEALFVIIIVWSLFWTGLALWHSAKRGQSLWFLIFLVVHTLGLLEIIYLFFVLKLKLSELFKK